MKWVENSGLQGVYKELAEIIGLDATIAVYKELKGQQVNFPTRLYDKSHVIEEVNKRYNGSNLKELAKEFNYTERWIRKIIHDIQEESQEFNHHM
mgnify:FL=1